MDYSSGLLVTANSHFCNNTMKGYYQLGSK